MKKLIVFLFLITLLFLNNDKQVVIPKESIRYRIIANNNSTAYQQEKWDINSQIIPYLIESITNVSNIEQARYNIKSSIPKISEVVNKINTNSKINYGENYFPEKRFKNVVYNEGNYESLTITLGSGMGDNFWCVLFPPLCLIEANNDNIDEVNYKIYIKDIINKYF